jgi:hypothetical protein
MSEWDQEPWNCSIAVTGSVKNASIFSVGDLPLQNTGINIMLFVLKPLYP